MKRLKYLLLMLCAFMLTSCSSVDREYQLIERPEINRSPLQGRWIVTSVEAKTNDANDLQSIVGSDAIFAPHAVVFASQKIVDPEYTVKKGKTDYLMKVGYNKTKEDLDISNDSLFVITIYDKERPLFTVYREKEDVAYIDIYGNLLQLVKTKRSLDDQQLQNLLKTLNSDARYYSGAMEK